MTDWTELELTLTGSDRDRIRYRERERYEGAPLAFELEVWHSDKQEWRRVNSLQARDWFTLGYKAGLKENAQVELGL